MLYRFKRTSRVRVLSRAAGAAVLKIAMLLPVIVMIFQPTSHGAMTSLEHALPCEGSIIAQRFALPALECRAERAATLLIRPETVFVTCR